MHGALDGRLLPACLLAASRPPEPCGIAIKKDVHDHEKLMNKLVAMIRREMHQICAPQEPSRPHIDSLVVASCKLMELFQNRGIQALRTPIAFIDTSNLSIKQIHPIDEGKLNNLIQQ